MTEEQKVKLIEDFKEWSGGFTPDECSHKEIKTYIKYSLPTVFDRAAVIEFLENY